ncbi:MAG TPA: cupin domain-containing protein [Caulobacter sp.]|nr:cupin domain-containing protein [Caulobacter sp.]
MTAAEIVALLDLAPHPEGGWFRETFRDTAGPSGRGASTAIYFLLEAGQESRWHRVDAAEVWHFHAGAPLRLSVGPAAMVLGADLSAGERPQIVVPAGVWQQARSLGAWTLVGCTVAPGFDFAGFEMAPDGWTPPGSATGPISS